jgi:uncharacterized protein YceH (UPF0502 family)
MTQSNSEEEPKPEFRPLTRHQRRVIGVLIEKSKTTPNAYPMTLNSITTGCNQKSNRSPQMTLAADDVELILDELRDMGAVSEIQGDGRVSKYKHKMYNWLGVSKVEMAIMGELLLRGEQTLGELRARAGRMEPIAGMEELKPLVKSLLEKGLMVELTPEGRGQIVTHNLYLENEIDHLRSKVGSGTLNDDLSGGVEKIPASVSAATAQSSPSEFGEIVAELRKELDALTARVSELEQNS